MERRDCELTFDERKVFVKLACHGWLIRFLKLVIPSLILGVSCATATPVQQAVEAPRSIFQTSDYLSALNQNLHESASIEAFESAMPESEFILSALVSFDKKKPSIS